MDTHYENATHTLDAVKIAARFLDGLHDQLHQARAERRSDADLIARQIGQAKAHIRTSLKLAEIHALLATVDAMYADEEPEYTPLVGL